MSEERKDDGLLLGIIVVLVLVLIGGLGLGGIMFVRMARVSQIEAERAMMAEQEARAMAEEMRARADAAKAEAEASLKAAQAIEPKEPNKPPREQPAEQPKEPAELKPE